MAHDGPVVVVDLETDGLDTETCNIAIYGAHNLETKAFTIRTWNTDVRARAQETLEGCTLMVTFNGKNFDAPIMQRHGLDLTYVRHADVWLIFKQRQNLIRPNGFQSLKLAALVEELGITDEYGYKGKIDYKIFRRKNWTEEEKKEIVAYCKQDLALTAKLWEWLVDKFSPLAEWIHPDDAKRWKHITTSPGSFVYKAICHNVGLPEEYDDTVPPVRFEGAYVSTPTQPEARGTIVCFDFQSLYPTIQIGINAYSENCSCCTEEEKWKGGGFFQTHGAYCSKQRGQIELFLLARLRERIALKAELKQAKKAGDKEKVKALEARIYAIKIIINTAYGASGSPKFKSIYSLNTASDTTWVGQQCIKYAIKRFTDFGLTPLYTDTDSVYVHVPTDRFDIAYAKGCAQAITQELSRQFNLPIDEFLMDFEKEIQYIQFFHDSSDGHLLKKHYLYLTAEGEVTVKGLRIIKRDCSRLAKLIFNDFVIPRIKEKRQCKFTLEEIDKAIESYGVNTSEGRRLLAVRFNTKDLKEYKGVSSIQAQISMRYGEGEHWLVKNTEVGAGKGVKYCTVEEAETLPLSSLSFDRIHRELLPFTEAEIEKDDQEVDEVTYIE